MNAAYIFNISQSDPKGSIRQFALRTSLHSSSRQHLAARIRGCAFARRKRPTRQSIRNVRYVARRCSASVPQVIRVGNGAAIVLSRGVEKRLSAYDSILTLHLYISVSIRQNMSERSNVLTIQECSETVAASCTSCTFADHGSDLVQSVRYHLFPGSITLAPHRNGGKDLLSTADTGSRRCNSQLHCGPASIRDF